jgi:Alternative complex III, ActD subunit
MSGKNTAVFGIYPTHESADAAVDTLRMKGFRNTDISVLFPQNLGSKEFGHVKGTKSAEGAVAGGGTGAAIGGALGWLAGIGMLAIPGVGPFIAAGPIVAALAGMGAGGAIGGTTGALIGFGIPEYQAKRYEGRMRKGGILLSVHADDQEWASKGKQILEQTGAEDISSTGEAKGDFANTDRPTPRVVHAAPSEAAHIAPVEVVHVAPVEPADVAPVNVVDVAPMEVSGE